METTAIKEYTYKDFASDQEVRWCPGCDDYVILRAMQKALPEMGVKKEDVKILLEDGFLTVSGEKKNEFEGKEEINIFRNERSFGKFERKFELAEDINPDEITAKFENGLLQISIAKLVPEKPKERIIEVK